MNISEYLSALKEALGQIDLEALGKVCASIQQVKARGGIIYLLGNGGSQANASHLALHLIERGIRARDVMAETAWLSASANDYSYESSAARLLVLTGQPGDALLVFSCSGNSPNVLNALQDAKRKGMTTLGLLGFGGGFALQFCDYAVVLGQHSYPIVEDLHSVMLHILAESLKQGIVPAKQVEG